MRIRTIKPEFFRHDGIFEAEIESGLPLRLAFIGLWGCCDRAGRFVWKPRQLKVQIMPYDNLDFSDVLDALESHGFVVCYEVDEKLFGFIPSFNRHQSINRREAASVLPEPNDENIRTSMDDDARTCMHMHEYARKHIDSGVNITAQTRDFVYKRDNFRCVRCGATDNLTVDHILPRAAGGNHARDNLRTLCKSCNCKRPVQGKELENDLAKDGYTVEKLERICMHVHASQEGKGREGKGRSSTTYFCPEPGADSGPEELDEGEEDSTEGETEDPVLTFPCVGKRKEWGLIPSKVAEWEETFPDLDVLAEARLALQWLRDNPAKRKTANGMARFLLNWLSRSQNRGGAAKGKRRQEDLDRAHELPMGN